MTRAGEITAVKKDMLQITFCRPDACAKCGACEGGKKQTTLWVKGEGQMGQIAVVDLPGETVAKASFIAYGMPLLLLIAGLIVGKLLVPGSDAAMAVGAAAGLLLSLVILKATEAKRAIEGKYSPKLLRILEEGERLSETDV